MMSPNPLSPDDATRRRHWRLFLAVEGILLLVAIATTWAAVTFHFPKWAAFAVSLLWSWLLCTLPICFLYLIGYPPVITLSPLIPSAEMRAFRRQLKGRPALSDDEFYGLFYAESGIRQDILDRIRRCLLEFDSLTQRAVPTDFLPFLDDELDYADVLYRVGEEFGVRFTKVDFSDVDGTLDNLVQLVHARLGER